MPKSEHLGDLGYDHRVELGANGADIQHTDCKPEPY